MKLFIVVLFSSLIYPSPFVPAVGKGLHHHSAKPAIEKIAHCKLHAVNTIYLHQA